MHPALIIWPLAALTALAGLCVIAPPRSRSLYAAPAGCTVTVLFLAVAYVSALWSH